MAKCIGIQNRQSLHSARVSSIQLYPLYTSDVWPGWRVVLVCSAGPVTESRHPAPAGRSSGPTLHCLIA